ncbi:MAG: hypothetical protein LBM97_00985 [Candidatus Nomurabacteria bacterium]|jgi:hypothetical protein|nr:hypothetical protein [Candidatus Nomurabacteria bacterium]
MQTSPTELKDNLNSAIKKVLSTIKNERERQVAEYRFGIINQNGKKATLEKIGQTLGITRERVRQIEHNLLQKLANQDSDTSLTPILNSFEKIIIRILAENGRVATLDFINQQLFGDEATAELGAKLAFVAYLSKQLTLIDKNKDFYTSLAIAEYGNSSDYEKRTDEIVSIITKNGEPMTLDELDVQLSYEHPSQIEALAKISSLLATSGKLWGLAKWPEIKPRTIRDKIATVMKASGKPMHFEEISKAIEDAGYNSGKKATTAAIHNELIKDKTYVLIGRGIYARQDWGFTEGRTVADVITSLLKVSKTPLTRDEITSGVLKVRRIQPNTIQVALGKRELFTYDRNTKTYTLTK